MSTSAERHRSPWLPWLPSLLVLWALVPGLARAAEFRSGDGVQVLVALATILLGRGAMRLGIPRGHELAGAPA
ncbi:MAG TPA: hypothetical protein VEU33_42235 [Archangium sp.]|nr:hypothetical protein [Archangium sp.]